MRLASALGVRPCACILTILSAHPGVFLTATAAQSATATKPTSVVERIAAANDLLDINTASPAELKALPGMGQAYAQRVIAGRPYSAKNQLATRGILPEEEYERIKPLIVAHRVKR